MRSKAPIGVGTRAALVTTAAALGALASACAPATRTPAASVVSTVVLAQDVPADGTTRAVNVHVETHPSQGEQRVIEGATASLVSSARGLGIELATLKLTPGHVYTLWVVAINRPGACSVSPCSSQDVLGNNEAVEADVTWGGGTVADASGQARFSAWVPAGRWHSSWFGHGYTAGEHAEVHAILNDHGPPLPGRLGAMLGSVRDGCTDESVPPPFPDSARHDGLSGPNACALVQDAIFIEGH